MRTSLRSLLALAAALVASLASVPASARTLDPEALRRAEVVIVRGSADHMEQVLRHEQIRFVLVDPDDLPNLPLHGQQVLMVNCTGQMSPAARERVRRFVTAGGFLYTTDHAVHYLLEETFPGYVRWNNITSQEAIFPMTTQGDRGLVARLSTPQGHPRWQLASGGMLFDVVDPHKVEVLMRSPDVARRYHTSGILGVRFHVGDGQVIHVTGHFYTQPGQRPDEAAAGRAFEQLSANVVSEKKEQRREIDRLYNATTNRAVTLQAAPTPAAPPVAAPAGGDTTERPTMKLRVLDKDGKYAHVRDAEGNEGYVPADSI